MGTKSKVDIMADGNGGGLGFVTQRKLLIDGYVAKGGAFVAQTKPYKSTATIMFDVVDAYGGPPATMAHAVAARQQEVRWFDFAQGQNVNDPLAGRGFPAPGSWTNQGKASETNGNADMVIEGISVSYRPPRFIYDPTADAPPSPLSSAYVKTMYFGIGSPGADPVPVVVVDPAALASPPQLGSPFNLEQAIAAAIAPSLYLLLQWNKEQTEYIGSADEIPEGGARSYLRANGQPRVDNRYKIPEGYLWRHPGEVDSQFNVLGRLGEGLVVPLNAIPLFAQTPADITLPTKIAVDIVMRVHGIQLRRPSTNA